MPGLTLISASDPESAQPLLQAALPPASDDRYSGTPLWTDETLHLVATSYPGYPIQTFDTSEYQICLEGGLYGTPSSQLPSLLRRWAEAVLGSGGTSVPRTLLRTDGDFVVVFRRRATSDWAVVNDVMGRLPLYVHTTTSRTCITRDFHLFNRLDEGPSADRLGAAQQLTFGYPLGRRTLRKNVERLPPGTVLRSGPSVSSVRQHRVVNYNFDNPRRHAARSLHENAHALVDRLEQDAQARCEWSDGPAVLALSGGLDSRAIACRLQQSNCSFEATTFARSDSKNASDVRYARKIAERLDLSHHEIPLPSPSIQHHLALLQAKGGLNPFDVGYMIPYLETLAQTYRDGAHLLTGNGGALLRDLQPRFSLESMDDLLGATFAKAWLSPNVAARLVDVAPYRLISSVHDRLSDYPESSLESKHVHFAFERLFKYSFEGEDRNRAFLWSSAPYHGLHFTQYALNCPNSQKADYRLYRHFLRALSPQLLQIGYSNFYGFRMTALQYNVYRGLRWIVRQLPVLRRWLNQRRGRTHSYSPQSDIPRLLRVHLATSEGSLFNVARVLKLARHPGDLPARTLDNILTVALALDPSSLLDSQTRSALFS